MWTGCLLQADSSFTLDGFLPSNDGWWTSPRLQLMFVVSPTLLAMILNAALAHKRVEVLSWTFLPLSYRQANTTRSILKGTDTSRSH